MITSIAGFLGVRELFVKIGIGLLTLLAIGFAVWRMVAWYQGQIDDAYDRGVQYEQSRNTARSNQITGRQNEAAAVIKDEANAKVITIVRDAADLRVRGPGKAACPPVAVASTGGPEAAVASPGDPVGGVHPPGGGSLAAVRWDDLVTIAEQHDRLLIEVVAWRQNYEAQSKIITEEQK
jgi:hypothetical protein